MLYPFQDAPHLTDDGLVVHGSNPLQQAIAHSIVSRFGVVLPASCVLPTRQARPPEPGGGPATFPFMQICRLPAIQIGTANATPILPPWFSPQPIQASSSQRKPARNTDDFPYATDIGVYALQALTTQDVSNGTDTPHQRLVREVVVRAREVRASAYFIQTASQRLPGAGHHYSIQPVEDGCWEIVNEMDAILTALSGLHSEATQPSSG